MKCMTCNECSDKKYCAILNGMKEVPFPLGAYKIKGCHDQHIKELNKIKETVKMPDEHLKEVQKFYEEWLDRQNDLLEIPIKNSIERAFYAGYEKSLVSERKDNCTNCTNGYCKHSIQDSHSECLDHDKFEERK